MERPQYENHHFAKLQTITSIFPLFLNIWNPQPSGSPAPFWEEYIKVYFKVPEIQSKEFGAYGFLAIGWANIYNPSDTPKLNTSAGFESNQAFETNQ